MNTEHQRIAIAEACGWTTRPNGFQRCFIWVDPDGHDVGQTNHEAHMETAARNLPDYLSDLNAMHEAEKVLTAIQCNDYDTYIMHRLRESEINPPANRFKFHATASQRAEALLRTLNLWKD